jgi:hypothetical protein
VPWHAFCALSLCKQDAPFHALVVIMVVCPRHPCMRRVCGHGARPLRRVALRPPRAMRRGAARGPAGRAAAPAWHPRLCPAPLVTETADTRIVLGLEGRGNTGLSYCFGHLHVYVHAVCAPFRHAPHRQVCRTEAPRTRRLCPAASTPSSPVVRTPSHAPPATAQSPGMRRSQHARALMRSLWLIRRDRT